jgi:hypothetical protein
MWGEHLFHNLKKQNQNVLVNRKYDRIRSEYIGIPPRIPYHISSILPPYIRSKHIDIRDEDNTHKCLRRHLASLHIDRSINIIKSFWNHLGMNTHAINIEDYISAKDISTQSLFHIAMKVVRNLGPLHHTLEEYEKIFISF